MAKKTVKNTVNTTDKKEMEENAMKTMNIKDIISQAQTDIATKAAKIRERVTQRVGFVRAYQGATDSAELKAKVSPFLTTVPDKDMAEGADVVLCKKLDTSDMPYAYEDDMVVLGWSANPEFGKERKRKNVLWVHVKPAHKEEKSMADKAVSFFQKRFPDMQETVIRELFEAGFDGEEVTLCVHPSAKPVVLKAQAGGGQYLLQVPDPKGNFVPNKPIAYAVGNRVYVSIPGTKNGRPWTFRANPKRDDQE
ncbi:MAG: hypothetical protein IKK43_04115 [Clostridia bacterium]|nr:hypothetical protein [Clostridia bacterium]